MGLINPDLTGNMYGGDLKPVIEAILREFNGNISNENISDDLKLEYGQIASWNITNNYIYPDPDSPSTPSIQTTSNTVGDGSATSAGVTFNENGIYACEASQLLANANVRILTDGSAYFSGEITAGSGAIGGWTIGSTALTAGTGSTTVGLDSGGTNPAIYAGSATPGSAPFRVTQAGELTASNATITGAITATSGAIGGWTVGSDSLTDTAGLVGMSSAVTAGDDIRFFAGDTTPADAPFNVTEAGVLTASSAIISGSITADSGTIGGFTLTSTEMYGGIIKTSSGVESGSAGVIMDTDGLRGYDPVLGEVFNIPTDGSAPTFSSGVIENTTFEINTNAVMRTSSTVGDGSADSAGVLINNTGFYACEANQTLANANVKILDDGTATFSGSVKGGQTDFNTGAGFFLGLSGGEYKFSIGDPDTSYITWDATNLRIKGSVELSSILGLLSYETADLPVVPATDGPNSPGGNE